MSTRTGLLIVIVIAAALLRALVVRTGFWGDEVTSIFSASQNGVHALVDRLAVTEINPPLFFVTLQAWLHVAKNDDVLLKMLPLAFGLAVVPLTYVLASAGASPRVALLATALVASNDTLAFYASELRPYSLATCLSVLAAIFYCRRRSRGGFGYLVASIACATAILYTTYLGAIFIAAVFIASLLTERPSRARLADALAFALVPFALFAPWLPMARLQFSNGAAWDEPMALVHRPVWIASRGYQTFPFDVSIGSAPPHAVANALGLLLVAALVALLVASKRDKPRAESTGHDSSVMQFVVAIYLVAVCLLALADLGSVRYVAFALPFGLIGVAKCIDACLTWIASRASHASRTSLANRGAAAFAAATIAFSAFVLWRDAREPKSGVRAVAERYGAPLPADTLVVVAPDHAAETFAYYTRSTERVYGFPRWAHPDIFDLRGYGALWNQPAIVDQTLENLAELKRQGLRKLVYVEALKGPHPLRRLGQLDYPKLDDLYGRLKSRYDLVATDTYPGIAEPAVASLFRLDQKPKGR